jgi:hypothetical protein
MKSLPNRGRKPLYKALTPEQQERADAVLLLLGSSGGVEF